jgi:L-asparaginase/Glu-tRNA(Gln) amidotransferase subunit D
MPRFFTSGEIPLYGEYVVVPRPLIGALQRYIYSPQAVNKIIAINGCRQTGKTTTLLRLIESMRTERRAVKIDLRMEFTRGQNRSIDGATILQLILSSIAIELGQPELLEWIKESCSMARSFQTTEVRLFSEFLSRICKSDATPLLIVIDEFDALLQFGKRWEYLLDCLYNHIQTGMSDRVRFIISGLRPPNALSDDWERSKYTIFEQFEIGDFPVGDPEVEDALRSGLGAAESQIEVVRAVLASTGGQPYLTCKLLEQTLESGDISRAGAGKAIKQLVGANRFANGRDVSTADVHFDYHAGYLGLFPRFTIRALEVFVATREGKREAMGKVEPLVQSILIGSGLMVSRSGQLEIKSSIYREVFDETWESDVRGSGSDSSRAREPQIRSVQRPKVLVINLGGTLGMEVLPDGRVVEPDDPHSFFQRFDAMLDIFEPIIATPTKPTDGANITPEDWRILAETIFRARTEDIRGVLVIQGTDTLAYTASAIAFALGPQLDFPVCFTGSQAPYTVPHADALANVLRACRVLEQFGRRNIEQPAQLPEVVVVFGGAIFRAVRIEKKDDFQFDGFHAPSQGPIAIIGESIQLQSAPRQPTGVADWTLRADYESDIAVFTQFPGLNPDHVLHVLNNTNVKGIVFESLGVGNLPTRSRYQLMGAISAATKTGVPVLITSRYPVVPEFVANYQPATAPLKEGAISAGDMTPAAAITKFMWSIRQVDLRIARSDIHPDRRLTQIQTFMRTNYIGEIGDEIGRKLSKTGGFNAG